MRVVDDARDNLKKLVSQLCKVFKLGDLIVVPLRLHVPFGVVKVSDLDDHYDGFQRPDLVPLRHELTHRCFPLNFFSTGLPAVQVVSDVLAQR